VIEEGKWFGEIKDFLTDEERVSIREQVLEMKDKWRPIYPSDHLFGPVRDILEKLAHAGLGFYHLGYAVYIMKCSRMPAEKAHDEIYDELMVRFEWLFERVCSIVEKETGVPTELHGITTPGFHISTVPFDIKGAADLHEDFSITKYVDGVDVDSIISLIAVIEEPEGGAWLEWQHPLGDLKRYDYNLNSLHAWRGKLFHRVGDYQTKLGEHRITLQCHYYFDKERGVNRVYF